MNEYVAYISNVRDTPAPLVHQDIRVSPHQKRECVLNHLARWWLVMPIWMLHTKQFISRPLLSLYIIFVDFRYFEVAHCASVHHLLYTKSGATSYVMSLGDDESNHRKDRRQP